MARRLDIEDPASVKKAIEEYDHLGRMKFLSKYGFRPARRFLLELGGSMYDSKAIVGAAYGYEHPARGPLRPSEFSGGQQTVATLLMRLGFKVTAREDPSSSYEALLKPAHLCTRPEVLSRPCPVPARPGVYAWYFKELPKGVPVESCVAQKGFTLLYIGISPKKPPKNGKPPSRQTLRTRIRYHFQGNAEGSTLRLTLGCLLAGKLKLKLRRVGSGYRKTFHEGEKRLSLWMEQNAFVTWMQHDEPWKLEHRLIKSLSLPLNLAGNERHPFHQKLSQLRENAKATADSLPVVSDGALEGR